MYLIIDTTKLNQFFLGLVNQEGKFVDKKYSKGRKPSDIFIGELDSFLKDNKIGLKDIKKIVVVTGPGSFSSVRSGVIFANAISFAADIPIIGVKANEFSDYNDLARKIIKLKFKTGGTVLPFYGKEPNITRPH